MPKPKVVQIETMPESSHFSGIWALGDDGSVWWLSDDGASEWGRQRGPFDDASETESVKLAAVVEFIQHSAQRLNRTNNLQMAVSDAAVRMAAAAEMLRQIAEGGGEKCTG